VGDGFDSVVYVNVLEHIEDDRAELALAHRALRPGGHLLVYVPALSFLYSDLDRSVGHFRRYQKKQLVGLARQSGFTVVSARYFDMLGILPWFVVYVLLKKTIRPGDVSLYDRLVVPVMRSLEGIIAPPIGKNLLLIGRKD
jgi:SAM-dependent methyltransferase